MGRSIVKKGEVGNWFIFRGYSNNVVYLKNKTIRANKVLI